MHSTYEPVDRASKTEDIVRLDSKATIDESPYELWSRDNQATRLGVGNYGEQFDTELTGVEKGAKKSFSVVVVLTHFCLDDHF